jgi:hypothetical protein
MAAAPVSADPGILVRMTPITHYSQQRRVECHDAISLELLFELWRTGIR